MPVAGRKPKPEGQRRHRVLPVHDWTEIEDKPFEDAAPLPRYQPSGMLWPKATRKWWGTVSTMPHCCLWDPSDWQFALDTAVIAAAFHNGDLRHANELRQREKIMGLTVDARRDLRIRYIQPVPPEERKGIAAIADYRNRLGK